MKSVWKFPLEIVDKQTINMPKGAHILCVSVQNNKPHLWALVEKQDLRNVRATTGRKIIIHGTGHPANDVNYDDYIGTFQMDNGFYVFHTFDGGEV